MRTLKIYVAIGHFKDDKNICSVVLEQHTKKDFMTDCYANGFAPYVVLTEKMLDRIFNKCESGMEVYEQVTKMTSNYRVWNIVTDYLTQAGYLITDEIKEMTGREISEIMCTEKWRVYGEYGGVFTNLRDAKKCARSASLLEEDKHAEIWNTEDGCHYIEYHDGKLVRDGWTIKK
jgi:hypothetical protein